MAGSSDTRSTGGPAAGPPRRWDVFVVGAGHAGCEAALAAARAGARVVVVTLRRAGIGQMSCNPAIGGVAKGHLVREIDALGGAMGEVADATALQSRQLNASRGAAVRSTRVQSDARAYQAAMAERLQAEVEVWEDEVVALKAPDRPREPWTVICARAGGVSATTVVVTTGTFLAGTCHVGPRRFAGGRVGEPPVAQLSAALRGLGLVLGRFKTGTTPRLAADSIRWAGLPEQWGDTPTPKLSARGPASRMAPLPCHLTATQPATHASVRDNLHRSPLYGGVIEGRGPRYCPSLEDKVVRFPDRARHQVFLEPEGHGSPRVYPSGLSTSLPEEAQQAFLRTIPGLEEVRVLQWGYAVEYDYAPPTQLTHALMVRRQPGLFLAGQINGSSGYEEAAAQGLMAGLNAARWGRGEAPAVLGRHEAYIGVLVDDLTTAGVDEPYRIFTGRAEHRLALRESNAVSRLAERARAWGLWDEGRWRRHLARRAALAAVEARLRAARWTATLSARLRLPPTRAPAAGAPLEVVLRRPDMSLAQVWAAMDAGDVADDVLTEVAETLVYSPFIAREAASLRQLATTADLELPETLDYSRAAGLCAEAKEKLSRLRPATLAQAARIPGIDPVALAILRIHARRHA